MGDGSYALVGNEDDRADLIDRMMSCTARFELPPLAEEAYATIDQCPLYSQDWMGTRALYQKHQNELVGGGEQKPTETCLLALQTGSFSANTHSYLPDFINYDAEECRTDAVAKSADEVCSWSLIFFLERELHSSTLLKV